MIWLSVKRDFFIDCSWFFNHKTLNLKNQLFFGGLHLVEKTENCDALKLKKWRLLLQFQIMLYARYFIFRMVVNVKHGGFWVLADFLDEGENKLSVDLI